jgi:hypothetical protein
MQEAGRDAPSDTPDTQFASQQMLSSGYPATGTAFRNVQVSGLTMRLPAFDDRPPDSAKLTPYDERHLATYLRLLDAWEDGADWREAVQVIFGLDAARDPERARLVHDSHLSRARWMMEAGHEHLLRPRLH